LVLERGGALVHTHPLVPAHQAHWMGAVEILSDAVLGECAHGFDLETRFTETLWFAVLELGNRVTATASTDAALGRSRTRSPGDRRVWVRADELSWPAIVDALRKGRTVATDNGPVFAMLRVGESGPGDTIRVEHGRPLEIEVETLGRHPLRSVELIYRGRRVARIESARGRDSGVFKTAFAPPEGEETGWLVARAEDERGHWAMTSPIYIESAGDGEDGSEASSPLAPSRRARASAVVFEISNASRFAALTTDFFAHAIVTVAPPRAISSM